MRFLNRAFPIVVAASLFAVILFSEVPVRFMIFDEIFSGLILASYAFLMLAIIPLGQKYPVLHRIGGALAVLVFSGRGIGFLELVVQEGRTDLIAAVIERLVIIIGLVMWHAGSVTRAYLYDHRDEMSLNIQDAMYMDQPDPSEMIGEFSSIIEQEHNHRILQRAI